MFVQIYFPREMVSDVVSFVTIMNDIHKKMTTQQALATSSQSAHSKIKHSSKAMRKKIQT